MGGGREERARRRSTLYLPCNPSCHSQHHSYASRDAVAGTG